MSELRESAKTGVWKRLIRLGMRECVSEDGEGAARDMEEYSMDDVSSQYIFREWYSFESVREVGREEKDNAEARRALRGAESWSGGRTLGSRGGDQDGELKTRGSCGHGAHPSKLRAFGQCCART